MTFDPNWFYSSLAQCAAAVVGLLGAVLATRLQQQYADAKASHEATRNKMLELEKDFFRVRAGVTRYAKFAEDRVGQMTKALEGGQDALRVNVELDVWGEESKSGSWYAEVSPEELAKYDKGLGAAKVVLAALEGLNVPASKASDLPRQFKSLSELQTLVSFSHPEVNLQPLQVLTGRVLEAEVAYQRHLLVASVRVPTALALILAWLCVTGLVVPLAYLTSHNGASKHLLLSFFALGILAIPGYVAFELGRLLGLQEVSLR